MKKSFKTSIPVDWGIALKGFKSDGYLTLLLLGISVIFACSSLIVVNYYTIKSLSAIRAFINGESHYSKAQNDGSRNLLLYMSERDERFFKVYKQNLNISIGDSMALKGLYAGLGRDELIGNFIKGRNDPADADDMIWLLTNFREVSYFKKCLGYWSDANNKIRLMDLKVNGIRARIQQGTYTQEELVNDCKMINEWDNSISELYTVFSETLELASRSVRKLLIVSDFTMIFLIVGLTGTYSAITIRRLLDSAKALAIKNQVLIDTNSELDRFVYSASHELRTPITSLKGLVNIIKEEDDILTIRNYLNFIDQSLTQQDAIIREIINYSRNKRSDLLVQELLLSELINSAIHRFDNLSPVVIAYTQELLVDKIESDLIRLKIIFDNLLSNTMKFIDPDKSCHTVQIRSRLIGKQLEIEIQDNGIGIHTDFREKIFDMFYVTHHPNRGSGLGLYITKETVIKLGGTIKFVSEIGKGTCFTFCIPVNKYSL